MVNQSVFRLSIAWTGLTVFLALILLVTMWPNPIDRGYESAISRVLEILHNRGVPLWFGYREFEFTANIFMFIPLGFFFVFTLPRKRWWLAMISVPLLSIAIETAQKLFLSQRYSSALDVAANTIGGYMGVFIALLIWSMVWSRDQLVFQTQSSKKIPPSRSAETD